MNREILKQANELNNKIEKIDKFIKETESRPLVLKYILSSDQYSYTIPVNKDLLEVFRVLALSELNNTKASLTKELADLN